MIYICVPTYNEAPTVGVLLWKIRQVMAQFPRDYQILVVDDASTDATAEVLEPYTRVLPLTVMHHSERAGYAASLERLLRESIRRSSYPRRDVVVTLQADFTEDPREIPTLVKAIEGGADAVTTSVLARPTVPASVRWGRRTLGWLLRRYEWPEAVTDPTSGFRAYRLICVKKALQETNGDALPDSAGWLTNALLLRAVGPHCRRVEETSVTLRYEHRHRQSRFRLREAASAFIRFARSPAPVPATAAAEAGRPTQAQSGGPRPAGKGGGRPRADEQGLRGRPRPRTGSRSDGSRQGAREGSDGDDAGQPTRARRPSAGDRRRRSGGGPRSEKRQGNGKSDAGAPASSRNAPESEGES